MAHDRLLDNSRNPLQRICSLPFWILLCLGGGVAGVLVDADHIPDWLFGVYPDYYPLNVLGFDHSRHLHSLFFLVGLGGLACTGGLLTLLVLIKRA